MNIADGLNSRLERKGIVRSFFEVNGTNLRHVFVETQVASPWSRVHIVDIEGRRFLNGVELGIGFTLFDGFGGPGLF
jgi:hypothetical protein